MTDHYNDDEQLFLAGVQCVVMDKNRILLGKRYKTSCEGDWALPGGHIRFTESAIDTAIRELKEETCLEGRTAAVRPGFLTYTTSVPYAHFPVIFFDVKGVPKLVPGVKFSDLAYFSIEDLPEPLFLPSKMTIEKFTKGSLADSESLLKATTDIDFFRLDLLSIRPEENRNRGYCITLIRDVSGAQVIRSWGRRTGRGWKTEINAFEEIDQAIKYVESMVKLRIRHDYLLAGAVGDISLHWLAQLFPADAEIKVQAGLLTRKLAVDPSFRDAFLRDDFLQGSLFDD